MIAQLSGKLVHKTPTQSVVDCNGVGYEILHSPFTAEKLQGESVSVFIHTHVREDALQLFGFSSQDERHLFKELLKVSGVGPKLALSIMSGMPLEDLLTALRTKDIARMQKIPGIGKKTAERLIVEVSDKIVKWSNVATEAPAQNAGLKENELESVLLNLGYQRPAIQRAVKSLKTRETEFDSLPLETLVKQTLREISAKPAN